MTDLAAVATAVGPNFAAVGGSGRLRQIVGALLTFGLLIAVLMVIVCAATWANASANESSQAAGTAKKTGLLVALGGAVFTGGALAWTNWLLNLGATP